MNSIYFISIHLIIMLPTHFIQTSSTHMALTVLILLVVFSIHELVMEIIKHAHMYSSNKPGLLAYWRNTYNEFMGHATATIEQWQIEYTESLPGVRKTFVKHTLHNIQHLCLCKHQTSVTKTADQTLIDKCSKLDFRHLLQYYKHTIYFII